MATRVITSIVGLPLLIGIILIGGIYLKISILIVSLIGMYEFYKAVSKEITIINIIGFLINTLYILFIDFEINENFRVIFLALLILSLIVLVIKHNEINIFDASVSLFGFLYVGLTLSCVYLVRISSYGQFLIWMIFICAWCSDTGAYLVGVNFGKHKITPILSPNKTLEGALGGVLFTGIGSAIYGYIISKIFITEDVNILLVCIIIGIIGSIFAQLGDLTASSIKRYTKIKDFGKIMPGHGGILDRFDSVLFTAPIVYILLHFIIK